MFNEKIKPAISIIVDDKIDQNSYKEVLLGIEEENIPYLIKFDNIIDLNVQGYESATSSNLDVSVGIDQNNICVHYSKLRQNSPLFTITINSSCENKRIIGANAARLVKRMPFKKFEY